MPLSSHSDDGIKVLMPGHFLVGRQIQSLPETEHTDNKLPMFRRWTLCQAEAQYFWHRWSNEYLQQPQKLNKWRNPTRNIQADDIVMVKEDAIFNTRWPLGRVIQRRSQAKMERSESLPSAHRMEFTNYPSPKLVLLQAQETSKGESSFGRRDVQAHDQVQDRERPRKDPRKRTLNN